MKCIYSALMCSELKRFRARHVLASGGAALAALMLSACGGGSNEKISSTPSPPPVPTPTPTPSPTPTPTSTNWDTPEVRRSDGPEFHGAITAWQSGATGTGSVIAVIDTGIDSDSPEFSGRIHSSSQDVAGNRGFEATDDHGTNVSMVAAAALNNSGVVGIAYEADVLALRADTPGTCAADTPTDTSLDCTFSDYDIARGIDIAVNSGATVVNLSLGGSLPGQRLLDAVARASAAGVVIIVASGNHGDGSIPDFDRYQPTPFASAIRNAGGNNVIIVGSVDEGGNYSKFAGPAGDQADFFLAARGERICCVYEDGAIFVGVDSNGEYMVLFAGTSFAAPQVSGAVALLKQAFPNLTGSEIVELLLDSARDAGDAGTDHIFGRGILDIARAFQPVGAMSVAGTTLPVSTSDPVAIGSPAMGDALSGQYGFSTLATDKYDRAYTVNLGRGLRDAADQNTRLGSVIVPGGKRLAAGKTGVAMGFTVADRSKPGFRDQLVEQLLLSRENAEVARVLAGRVAARIAPDIKVGFAVNESAAGLVAQLDGSDSPAFLIAGSAKTAASLPVENSRSFAARLDLDRHSGISVMMESGDVSVRHEVSPLQIGRPFARDNQYFRVTGQADRQFGALRTTIAFDWIDEEETVLGGWFGGTLGGSGSQTTSFTGSFQYSIASNWSVGGSFRRGWTVAEESGLIGKGSTIRTKSWSMDIDRRRILGDDDRLSLRLFQPLRVEGGGLNLRIPVDYDYATESAIFGDKLLSLTPSSREIVGEMRWSGPLGFGWGGASLFYRKNPFHRSDSLPDIGAAASYQVEF